MELEERVAALERRIAALEGEREHAPQPPPGGDFWALAGFKERLAAAGPAAADGGVLFTGTVGLPTGERYDWQYGELTSALLDVDWTETADAFAALGHAVRLRLLREIVGGRNTAAALAELDGLGTTGQIYHHLRQLTAVGWLRTVGRGRYEVPPARVVPLLVMVSASRPV
ncbi:ArsR/SmtB family transcription factor [Streptomyces yaizuensis]|uniref:Winged helix-turn-helix domain-containing protein n=1 Tax=Streptomyces yaizuensis TaxID=2989713 RepID=A0ABQ5P1R7_9ACTN|nr:helix-turn-helix domain-containing protein [Streptomyces sp. YSPA8]GLF96542.1 winged helix-turn-helix domain-containing protein [Streptomyces sp. YSPA8]